MDDANYMRRAISLASRTNPAVLGMKVGALVVRDGDIVGEGSRDFAANVYGIDSDAGYSSVLHAERVALHRAGGLAEGSTLYATVEPCIELDDSKTIMPCSRLIAEAGIARVVLGILDPNTNINGKGAEYLLGLGVEVCTMKGFEDMIQSLINVDPRRQWRLAQKDWRQSVTSSGRSARVRARMLVEMREAALSDDMTDDMARDYPA